MYVSLCINFYALNIARLVYIIFIDTHIVNEFQICITSIISQLKSKVITSRHHLDQLHVISKVVSEGLK